MIRSTVSAIPIEPSDSPSLPALYRANDGTVVLFVGETEGVVVNQGGGPWPVGEHDLDWLSCTGTRNWARLAPGERVTLENEQ